MLRHLPAFTDLDPEWFDAINSRVSSRRFDGALLDAGRIDRLERSCQRLAAAGLRARPVLIQQAPPEVFTGLIGSYGRIEGARSLVALAGEDDAAREVGYLGEAVVLDATAAGVDTCWIAAAFDAERAAELVRLQGSERVHAVIPIGTATTPSASERLTRTMLHARRRLPLDEIAEGTHRDWPVWAQDAAAAVRLAPSGANRQPWRMRVEDDAFVLTAVHNAYWTADIDLGIAMLHAELGAARQGIGGQWSVDTGEARFVPQAKS